uniref:Uncharacterized protein n=1 Tax=Physcomitrium patens TaxID=3218 RepID=A0A2K1J0J8_PHYPA|nr:hypothetical protein PHYPA_022950 [Physcomitrium patens]
MKLVEGICNSDDSMSDVIQKTGVLACLGGCRNLNWSVDGRPGQMQLHSNSFFCASGGANSNRLQRCESKTTTCRWIASAQSASLHV